MFSQFSVESEKQAAFTFRAFSDINNRTTNYSYTEKLLDGKENVIYGTLINVQLRGISMLIMLKVFLSE